MPIQPRRIKKKVFRKGAWLHTKAMNLNDEIRVEDEGESQHVLFGTLPSADGEVIQPVVDEFQEKVEEVRTVKKDEVKETQ